MGKSKEKQNRKKNRRPSSSSVEEIRYHGIWFASTNREIRSKVKALWRDNEELREMNTKSEVMIKIHEMQKELKEQKISDQKNHIEKLSAKIEKLKDKNDFNQRQKNQDIKKEISDYE